MLTGSASRHICVYKLFSMTGRQINLASGFVVMAIGIAGWEVSKYPNIRHLSEISPWYIGARYRLDHDHLMKRHDLARKSTTARWPFIDFQPDVTTLSFQE